MIGLRPMCKDRKDNYGNFKRANFDHFDPAAAGNLCISLPDGRSNAGPRGSDGGGVWARSMDLSDDCRPSGAARNGDITMKRSRRQFIRGRWVPQPAKLPSPTGTAEIASILVQTRPERMAAAETAIRAVDGAEIFHRDQRGKIVVVLETSGSETIGEALTRISLLPDVITACLVYHAVDAAESPSTEDLAS